MIVQAEQKYKGKQWVSYDHQFRREPLAQKDFNWSVTDPRFYNEALSGRVCCIAQCQYCLQDDHTAAYCPRNPNRPLISWFPNGGHWWWWSLVACHRRAPTWPAPDTHRASQETCRRFNDGRCKQAQCEYRHACNKSCQRLRNVMPATISRVPTPHLAGLLPVQVQGTRPLLLPASSHCAPGPARSTLLIGGPCIQTPQLTVPIGHLACLGPY